MSSATAWRSVEALDMILDEEEPQIEPARSLWRELWTRLEWWTEGRDYFGSEYAANTHRCALVKLAGLLHDVGKPEKKSFEEGGRMRFFGHADAGADIATRAMQRLRFSSRETDLVQRHYRGAYAARTDGTTGDARAGRRSTASSATPARRGIDTFFLSLADHLGTVGPRVDLEDWRSTSRSSTMSSGSACRKKEKSSSPAKLIDGEDLMAELGLARARSSASCWSSSAKPRPPAKLTPGTRQSPSPGDTWKTHPRPRPSGSGRS